MMQDMICMGMMMAMMIVVIMIMMDAQMEGILMEGALMVAMGLIADSWLHTCTPPMRRVIPQHIDHSI